MKILGGSFLQPVCSALLIVSELALTSTGQFILNKANRPRSSFAAAERYLQETAFR